MKENEKIFREKSLTKISTSEKLNDYIRVSGPGIWVILIVLILILVVFVMWSVFYKTADEFSVPLIVINGVGEAYLDSDVTPDMLKNAYITAEGRKFPLLRKDFCKIESMWYIDGTYINGNTVYPGDEVCRVRFDISLPDGCYKVSFSSMEYYPVSIAVN